MSDENGQISARVKRERWDAVVIGGGVMGLSSAWSLADLGHDVLLLEQETVGSGASRAAAGMLAPYAEIEFHEDALLAFAEESQKLWPAFAEEVEQESSVDIEFDDTGTLLVALDPDTRSELERQYDYQKSRGAPVEWLSADACREREALLSPYISDGVYSPRDYQVSNRRTVDALATIAREKGVHIEEHAKVERLIVEHGNLVGVGCSDDSTFRAERVVIASGAWTSLLSGASNLPKMFRPVKGQMVALEMPDELSVQHVVRGPGTYLVPKADGSLVVGATSEERGFDASLTAGGLYELLRGAYEILPASYEFPVKETWTGFRPGSRDNGPLLGETDVNGLFVVAGHYRNGIQQLPATYRAMRKVFAGGELPEWAAPFHCSRFHLFNS
jgi:glycine oxidase